MTASYLPQKVLAALFAVLVLSTGVAMIAGVGAAQTTDTATPTPTTTDTDDDSLVTLPTNETLSVSNDTRAIEATAENTNGTLSVTVYGVDAGGNETQVATGSINASGADATDTYSFGSVDATNYSEYRVMVDGDGAEHLTIQKVQVVSGGGGGGMGGIPLTYVVAGVIVALIALAVWLEVR